MLKSPATRYGYSSSRRDDSGETEWGGWREWSGISIADRKAGEICAEAALWGKNI